MDAALVRLFQDSGIAAMSDADILAMLGVQVIKSQDNQVWHWNGVIGALNTMYSEGFFQSLVGTPGEITASDIATTMDILAQMPVGWVTLNGLFITGCQISLPEVQATIAGLESVEPPKARSLLTAILAIGQPVMQDNWQQYGLQQLPQLSDVTAARAQWFDYSKIVLFMNQYGNALLNDITTSLATFKSAVNAIS